MNTKHLFRFFKTILVFTTHTFLHLNNFWINFRRCFFSHFLTFIVIKLTNTFDDILCQKRESSSFTDKNIVKTNISFVFFQNDAFVFTTHIFYIFNIFRFDFRRCFSFLKPFSTSHIAMICTNHTEIIISGFRSSSYSPFAVPMKILKVNYKALKRGFKNIA